MSARGDRIALAGLVFTARHGVHPEEKTTPQRFEVDVELELDLGPAGRADDLTRTVDYSSVAERVRDVVDGPSVDLIEALAERIAAAVLADAPGADAVVVRVRKPDVTLAAPLAWAGVEIRRTRSALPGPA